MMSSMMKWIALPLIVIGLCITTTATSRSDPKKNSESTETQQNPVYPGSQYPCDPTKDELLDTPTNLIGCPGVQVIEWRPTNNQEEFTGQSVKTIRVLNAACKLATRKFHEFVAKENLPIVKKNPADFVQFVSLMPFSGALGRSPRNLNDLEFRFAGRNDPDLFIDGWTGYKNKTIFIRNDVLNKNGSMNRKFITVFIHELYHAQSYYYGIYNQLENPKVDDEKYARKFTDYLGYYE